MGTEEIRYRRSKFSTRLPTDRLYTAGHAWLKNEGEGLWHIGFTKFSVRMLGEAVEMDIEIARGDRVEIGQAIGWIEGFKAVTDIYVPLAGCYSETNAALERNMALLRSDPYGEGWLYSIQGEPDSGCIDVEGYVAVLDEAIDKMLGKR